MNMRQILRKSPSPNESLLSFASIELISLFVLIILFVAVGGGVYLWAHNYVANQIKIPTQTLNAAKPTSTQLKPSYIIPTPGSITKINIASPPASFSFPYPTDCLGCVTGFPKPPPGYQSGEIISKTSGWAIQYVSVKKGTTPVGKDFSIPNATFFDTLSRLKVNETTQIVNDSDHKTYSFTRIADQPINGVTAQVYQSNMTTGIGTQTQYALFNKDDSKYMLSVEWTSDKDKSIFDTVTSSFRFALRPNSEVLNPSSQ